MSRAGRLNMVRRGQNKTRRDLSRLSEVTVDIIRRLEDGGPGKPDVWARLAGALDVCPGWLVFGVGA